MPSSEELIDAKTLGEVVVHLKYLRADVKAVGGKVCELSSEMAPRTELEEVESRINGKLEQLRADMESRSVSSEFDRLLDRMIRVGKAFAVVAATGGGIAAIVHFLDAVPVK